MNRMAAILIVTLAAVLWGFIGLCTRNLSAMGFNVIQMNAFRGIVCLAMLTVAVLAYDRGSLRIGCRRDAARIIGMAVAKVMMDICFLEAQVEVSLALSGILLSTDTFFMIGISLFLFKGTITGMKVLATFLGFFGCTLVMNLYSGLDAINFIGVLYGLGSGFFGALYATGMKITLSKGYKPYSMLWYMFLIGTVIYLPLMDLPGTITMMSGNHESIMWAFLLGSVFTLLPYYLYTSGLNDLEPITALIILFLEAVVSALIGVAIYGEEMNVLMVIGMALVLASTILMEVKVRKGKISF